jgi:hypothetical protein
MTLEEYFVSRARYACLRSGVCQGYVCSVLGFVCRLNVARKVQRYKKRLFAVVV